MKIILPEHIGEITLDQFQRYHELIKREDINDFEFNKRKVCIFTGLLYHTLDSLQEKDFVDILNQIDKALDTEHEFTSTFILDNINFGFIPNFDKIATKEFVDMDLYKPDQIDTLHKLMAILFRPIKLIDNFNNYSIQEYNGTSKYAELMKQMPLSVVNGALVFFCNLSKELLNNIQKSTAKELLKENKHPITSQNGVGIVLNMGVHEIHVWLAEDTDRQRLEANLRKGGNTKNL